MSRVVVDGFKFVTTPTQYISIPKLQCCNGAHETPKKARVSSTATPMYAHTSSPPHMQTTAKTQITSSHRNLSAANSPFFESSFEQLSPATSPTTNAVKDDDFDQLKRFDRQANNNVITIEDDDEISEPPVAENDNNAFEYGGHDEENTMHTDTPANIIINKQGQGL